MNIYKYTILLLFFIPDVGFGQRDFTMQVTVDKPVEAGNLLLFPGVKDNDSYWYMSRNVKLAQHDNGTPKISFIKWVYNEDSGLDEGIGGGVLHCVFGYGADEQELEDAARELKKVNSQGKIAGPIIFKEGTVTVSVPKLNDPEQEEVVAVAPAPTIEGTYVATNLQLDKRSASLLWESFNTPNPVVTFNFTMELAGYISPMEAKITINRDQIYKHERMQAGVATPWLSAEIGNFMDEMIDNGAIEIEQIGENFELQAAIDRAIEMATEEFFTPMGSPQGPDLKELAGMGGQNESYLDKATQQLNTSRNEARSENQRIRRENRAEKERADRKNSEIRKENRNERESARRHNGASNNSNSENSDGDDNSSEANDSTGRMTPSKAGYNRNEDGEVEYTPAEEEPELREEVEPKTQEEVSVPEISIVASYIRKKVKISGEKVISFKESHPTIVPMPFGGNLGVNRSNCEKCFLEVNLSDPVFKQRQLIAMVDGLNLYDFTEFVNFASLQVRKTHESGEISTPEVRISRDNFSDGGNLYTMTYGWKGDDDREQWLDYEYKVVWSFFGGSQVETEWQQSNANTINLSPPLQRKIVTISADRGVLQQENVRSAQVIVYYNLGEEEEVREFNLSTDDENLSGQIAFVLPKNQSVFDYQINWSLWGGDKVNSGRKSTSTNILHIDELPN